MAAQTEHSVRAACSGTWSCSRGAPGPWEQLPGQHWCCPHQKCLYKQLQLPQQPLQTNQTHIKGVSSQCSHSAQLVVPLLQSVGIFGI